MKIQEGLKIVSESVRKSAAAALADPEFVKDGGTAESIGVVVRAYDAFLNSLSSELDVTQDGCPIAFLELLLQFGSSAGNTHRFIKKGVKPGTAPVTGLPAALPPSERAKRRAQESRKAR